MSAAPTRQEIEERIDEKIRVLRGTLSTADREERKQALKEAFKELMQEQLARVGAWTLVGIGTMVVGALLYASSYILAVKAGWTPPGR